MLQVLVSFDKPVYYDMLKVWRERCLTNPPISCDVWVVQCKPASEWIGDIVNDLRERSSLKNPPLSLNFYSQNVSNFESLGSASLGSASLKHRFELDRENRTLFVRADECLIPGILHKTVEALSFFLHHWTFTNGKEGSKGNVVPFIWRTNLSSVLDFAGLQQYLVDKGNGFMGDTLVKLCLTIM